MFRELVGAILPRREGAGRGPARLGVRKTVMVADDDPDSMRTISTALAREDFRLERAGNAETAYRQISYMHPDLILVDAQMAGLNGARLAHSLLADEALLAIPIVALAGMDSSGNPSRFGRFDGEIAKPVDEIALPGRVNTFLHYRWPELSRSHTAPKPPTTAKAAAGGYAESLLVAIEAGLPDSQFDTETRAGLRWLVELDNGIEEPELMEYLRRTLRLADAGTVRGRGRFQVLIRYCRTLMEREPDPAPGMAQLRRRYLENRRRQFGNLEQALDGGDFHSIREAAHNLKGTGASYGFAEVTEIARAMESAAKREDSETLGLLLNRFDCYVGGVSRPGAAA